MTIVILLQGDGVGACARQGHDGMVPARGRRRREVPGHRVKERPGFWKQLYNAIKPLSSYIEWAAEQQTYQVCLSENQPVPIRDEAELVWDVLDADRFIKLAIRYPHLLTHEEQILWKLIRENRNLWRGHDHDHGGEYAWEIDEESLVFERLRQCWDVFVLAARGDVESAAYLAKWQEEGKLPKSISNRD